MNVNIEWPVIVRHSQHSELSYVESENSFNQEILESAWLYVDEVMIDSSMKKYHIKIDGNEPGIINFAYIDMCSESEMMQYVKEYMSAKGQCCVAKLNFKSVENVMELVRKISE